MLNNIPDVYHLEWRWPSFNPIDGRDVLRKGTLRKVPRSKPFVAVVRKALLVHPNHVRGDIEANVHWNTVHLPRVELPVDITTRDINNGRGIYFTNEVCQKVDRIDRWG